MSSLSVDELCHLDHLQERMKKNLELQEWLLQKEQREMDLLASESAKQTEIERDRRRKDDEFRRRAAKQKAKLKRQVCTAKKTPRFVSQERMCSLDVPRAIEVAKYQAQLASTSSRSHGRGVFSTHVERHRVLRRYIAARGKDRCSSKVRGQLQLASKSRRTKNIKNVPGHGMSTIV